MGVDQEKKAAEVEAKRLEDKRLNDEAQEEGFSSYAEMLQFARDEALNEKSEEYARKENLANSTQVVNESAQLKAWFDARGARREEAIHNLFPGLAKQIEDRDF